MPNGVGTCRRRVGDPASVFRDSGSIGSSQFWTVRSGRVSRRSRRAVRQASEADGTIGQGKQAFADDSETAPAEPSIQRVLNVLLSHHLRKPLLGNLQTCLGATGEGDPGRQNFFRAVQKIIRT